MASRHSGCYRNRGRNKANYTNGVTTAQETAHNTIATFLTKNRDNVNCHPTLLSTASIVSKKAVEGTSSLVLDVKFGSAAFMQTKQEATTLAHEMVRSCKSYSFLGLVAFDPF